MVQQASINNTNNCYAITNNNKSNILLNQDIVEMDLCSQNTETQNELSMLKLLIEQINRYLTQCEINIAQLGNIDWQVLHRNLIKIEINIANNLIQQENVEMNTKLHVRRYEQINKVENGIAKELETQSNKRKRDLVTETVDQQLKRLKLFGPDLCYISIKGRVQDELQIIKFIKTLVTKILTCETLTADGRTPYTSVSIQVMHNESEVKNNGNKRKHKV